MITTTNEIYFNKTWLGAQDPDTIEITTKAKTEFKDSAAFFDNLIASYMKHRWVTPAASPSDFKASSVSNRMFPSYVKLLLIYGDVERKFKAGEELSFYAWYEPKHKKMMFKIASVSNPNNKVIFNIIYYKPSSISEMLKESYMVTTLVDSMPDEAMSYMPDELKRKHDVAVSWSVNGIVYKCKIIY